jgi:hypothetical protein
MRPAQELHRICEMKAAPFSVPTTLDGIVLDLHPGALAAIVSSCYIAINRGARVRIYGFNGLIKASLEGDQVAG